jgi:hypothetical protein
MHRRQGFSERRGRPATQAVLLCYSSTATSTTRGKQDESCNVNVVLLPSRRAVKWWNSLMLRQESPGLAAPHTAGLRRDGLLPPALPLGPAGTAAPSNPEPLILNPNLRRKARRSWRRRWRWGEKNSCEGGLQIAWVRFSFSLFLTH